MVKKIKAIMLRMRKKKEIEKLRNFYQTNDKFRIYCGRCAANYGVTAEEILCWALTREVAQLYLEQYPGPVVKSTYAPMGECV